MQKFEFQHLDGGRLIVNRQYVEHLRCSGLVTFESLLHFKAGSVAKNVLPQRTTTRLALTDAHGRQQVFYLKRHGPPPWREYVKPWLRLTRPIIGAGNEWRAILEFHGAGIATMTPVAFGKQGRCSLLVTRSLEGCVKLSDWMQGHEHTPAPGTRSEMIDRLARLARRMHDAGLHHQDFYLHHLMLQDAAGPMRIYVIDLGRARRRRRLSRRWIVKDLAQLNHSATMLTSRERRRLLETYLGRRLGAADEPFVRRIDRKAAAISRHSRKNRL